MHEFKLAAVFMHITFRCCAILRRLETTILILYLVGYIWKLDSLCVKRRKANSEYTMHLGLRFCQ